MKNTLNHYSALFYNYGEYTPEEIEILGAVVADQITESGIRYYEQHNRMPFCQQGNKSPSDHAHSFIKRLMMLRRALSVLEYNAGTTELGSDIDAWMSVHACIVESIENSQLRYGFDLKPALEAVISHRQRPIDLTRDGIGRGNDD